ncbi:ALK and LTK ligand 2 [Rhinophrynus dorsalis]
MRDHRCHALLALVLLMLSSGYCKERTDPSNINEKNLMNLIMKIIKDFKKYNLEEGNGVQYIPRKEDYSLEEKDEPDYGYYQDEQRVEIFPRDLRMKGKFIKHLTGRLSFNTPECNKIFRRLYNTTRDCTTPAHFKRCARLLKRLAYSPSCMDG